MASTNLFDVLDARKKKKSKKDEDKKKSKKSKKEAAEFDEKLWAQATTAVSNWADCDSDEDEFAGLGPAPSFGDEGAEGGGGGG
eukprot:CAMPEP_0183795724 /NCGR_PEP_ID=MMETSP0803_2-20130417/5229_1 /TAXON_ID=195967 /ORGANISM="Crustomastix stigmata, Strain CCMP3273" /LENGTH=83 /DNA_ID=CAMNT_0026040209 /DNA_START=272 /DNA_END=520 /DNA_ORIENTATION=-